MADDPSQATAEPTAATPQPAAEAAPPVAEPDIHAAMRSLVGTIKQSQVASSKQTLNEESPPSEPAPSPKPVEPEPIAASAEATEGEASASSDDAASSEPEKKSRRALAQEERDAVLAEAREEAARANAEAAKLQKAAADREARDAKAREVHAELLGSDEEYHALLDRKARERDLGLLSVEDDDKLARWAANRKDFKPVQDIARSEGYQSGHDAGQMSVLSIQDAEVTQRAGVLKIPLAELAQTKGFGDVTQVFYDHGAQNLAAEKQRADTAEQRSKELSDTVANLEAELSSLRAKTAGAGRIPERGGQSSTAPVGRAPSWRNLTPVQKMEAELSGAAANGRRG